MNILTTCKLGFVTMVGALTVGIVGTAEAAGSYAISGFLGQPQNPSDYTCFTNGNGAVSNQCSSTRRFCVTLPVDHAGSTTITVTDYAPDSSHNIGCFAQAVDRYAGGAGWTGQKYPGVMGSDQIVTLGTI